MVKTGFFSKNYTYYTIKTKPFNYEVQRRYSDFLWLRDILVRDFPGCYIPPLPQKGVKRSFDHDFVQLRMLYLQKFLDAVLEHKELTASLYFLSFLKTTDRKQFDQIKKELWKYTYPISVKDTIFNGLI